MSFISSIGFTSVMPKIYEALLSSPDVDKFPSYYTLTLMTGITVALPIIGIYCLREVYKSSVDLLES